MSAASVLRRRLVIADSRSPGESHLRELLERASTAHEVELVGSSDAALALIANKQPDAILTHAALEAQPDLPPASVVLASLAIRHRHHHDIPVLLYTSEPGLGYEGILAQLAVPAPLLLERRLVACFEDIIAELMAHAEAAALLRTLPSVCSGEPCDCIPRPFRVDRFLQDVESAVLSAAAREHPDRTEAAAALRMPVETFDRRRRELAIDDGGPCRPDFQAQQGLLWCSRNAAPPAIAEACGAEDVELWRIAPGSLHPNTLTSPAPIAAVVEVSDAAGAVDAWVLQRSVRPFLLAGVPPAPVRYLLEELHVQPSWLPGGELPPALFRAGRAAAKLYSDEDPSLRLQFGRGGAPAWPTDVADLLRRLDSRILKLASATICPVAEAARAVGLAESTYRARLHRALRV